MNLSKELKKRRDAEERQRKRSIQPSFYDNGVEQSYVGGLQDNARKILNKNIDINDFAGLDGYVLAYDETNDKFYLKKDEGGGGGGGVFSDSGFGAISNILFFITFSDSNILP